MQKLIQCSQIDPGSVYDGTSNGTEYLPLKPVMVNDGMRKKKNWVPDTHNYLGNSHWFLLIASSGDFFFFNLSKGRNIPCFSNSPSQAHM